MGRGEKMYRYLSILIAFSLLFFYSRGENSYCVAPPFLTTSISPNVLIMLDNSGSMKEPMYEQTGKSWRYSCSPGKYMTNFDPDKSYYGIFDSNRNYTYDKNIPVDTSAYSGTPYDVNVDTSVKGAFVESDCEPSTDENCWSGNFLNWLVTRRIDAARMVLVGGKVENRDGYDYDGDWKKEWKILGNNEPSDYTFCKKYVNSEDYSPFNSSAVFQIESPADKGNPKNKYDPYEKLIVRYNFIEDEDGNIIGEFGKISLNHKWKTVKLKRNYTNPIVIAKPISYNGSDAAILRIRNVTSNSFQIKIQEWKYYDGKHVDEDVSYIVVEKGVHNLKNGKTLIANKISVSKYIDRFKNGCGGGSDVSWKNVNFPQTLLDPVVLTSITSFNGSDPVTTRLKNVSSSGFKVSLEEEEKNGSHTAEDVSYIAVESGKVKINNFSFAVCQRTWC